jgi:hypothetical protein
MIFFDEHYWSEEKPVYPLLHTLADGTPYADQLHITDDGEAIADTVEAYAREREG